MYDSISLSPPVAYLPPCYHTNLLCALPDATDIPPNIYILYQCILGINLNSYKQSI